MGGGGLLSADANASKDTSLTCSISTLRGQKEKIEEDLTGNAPASDMANSRDTFDPDSPSIGTGDRM